MKCDKCQCELGNLKGGVCPKCGAPIVYVNEDYLARRKAYEEAKQSASMTEHVTVSTRNEYDAKHGRDTAVDLENENNEEGLSEETGLSFADVFTKVFNKLSDWWEIILRRVRGRRGKDNKVIRSLNYGKDGSELKDYEEGEEERINAEKLLVSHKKFKSRMRIIIPAFIFGAAAVVGLVILINFLVTMDRSRIFYVSGSAGQYIGDEKPVITGDSSLEIVYFTGEDILAKDGLGNFIVSDGKTQNGIVGADKILCYDPELEYIIYEADGKAYGYVDGMSTELVTSDGGDFTEGCMTDGSCYGLVSVTMDEMGNAGEYVLRYGNAGGYCDVVSRDENEKDLVCVRDKTIWYLDMTIKEYGQVEGKTLTRYDGNEITRVAANVDRCTVCGNYILYTNENDELFAVSLKTLETALIGRGVTTILDDAGDLDVRGAAGGAGAGEVYFTGTAAYTLGGESIDNIDDARSDGQIRIYNFSGKKGNIRMVMEDGGEYEAGTAENITRVIEDDKIGICYVCVGGLYRYKDGVNTYLQAVDTLIYNAKKHLIYAVSENGTVTRYDRTGSDGIEKTSGKVICIPQGYDRTYGCAVSGGKIFYINTAGELVGMALDGGETVNYGVASFFDAVGDERSHL